MECAQLGKEPADPKVAQWQCTSLTYHSEADIW